MSTCTTVTAAQGAPALPGQTVVGTGHSAGIDFKTARHVGPANTALTGATYDIDGGQELV
jgi:hypothetical protein